MSASAGVTIDSAQLKIDRAEEHITDLNKLFCEKPPFSYILETNTKTGERATFAKKNEPVIAAGALICGDAIHNLRSALDHAYWKIVFPVAKGEGGAAKVQFPFSETAARLNEAIKRNLAHKVSPAFLQALEYLKPHGEMGGNELLYLLHRLDIIDKHRLLIPTGDYTRLTSDMLRSQIPEFPNIFLDITLFQTHRHLVWNGYPMLRNQRRKLNIPLSGILEQELKVPVDIVFSDNLNGHYRPVVETLYQLVDVTKKTIDIMRSV